MPSAKRRGHGTPRVASKRRRVLFVIEIKRGDVFVPTGLVSTTREIAEEKLRSCSGGGEFKIGRYSRSGDA